MGQDCSSCKICGDQEEIRAESSISSNNIISKNEYGSSKDKNHKTIQKLTNTNTATTSQTYYQNQLTSSPKKSENQKYKRKEGRKSTLDSIKFSDKNELPDDKLPNEFFLSCIEFID